MTHRFPVKALIISIAAMAAGLPGMVSAESNFVTGSGTLTANANVDFRITIPKILFLQVGTGTMFANNTTINLIDFVVPAANVGNGTPVAATASSGDLNNGVVTAIVRLERYDSLVTNHHHTDRPGRLRHAIDTAYPGQHNQRPCHADRCQQGRQSGGSMDLRLRECQHRGSRHLRWR
jgi:hypothetical protein